MDTKDWLIVKTLHATGSITKASEQLFMSQPALSKRIQHLEEEFGVKLILRSSNLDSRTLITRREVGHP